jgi:hypothetical protein
MTNDHLLTVNSIHWKASLTTHQTTTAEDGQTLRLLSVRVFARGRHVRHVVPGPLCYNLPPVMSSVKLELAEKLSRERLKETFFSHRFNGFQLVSIIDTG